jgi:hypothetical protein
MAAFLQLVIVGIGTGLFSALVSFCLGDPSGVFNEGRIFSRIGRYFIEQYDRQHSKHEAINESRVSYGHDPRIFVNWWKLGVCPYCYNVWLTFAGQVATIVVMDLAWMNLFWLPVALGFSHYALRKTL